MNLENRVLREVSYKRLRDVWFQVYEMSTTGNTTGCQGFGVGGRNEEGMTWNGVKFLSGVIKMF